MSHGKVTVMEGVKLAPGANISHTNHAIAVPPSQQQALPSHLCFVTVLPSTVVLLLAQLS